VIKEKGEKMNNVYQTVILQGYLENVVDFVTEKIKFGTYRDVRTQLSSKIDRRLFIEVVKELQRLATRARDNAEVI